MYHFGSTLTIFIEIAFWVLENQFLVAQAVQIEIYAKSIQSVAGTRIFYQWEQTCSWSNQCAHVLDSKFFRFFFKAYCNWLKSGK